MKKTRLGQEFYQQDTIELARELLGKVLVHQLPNGTRLSGRIIETEAYLGVEDQAAHSFGGRRTPRTEVMFGPPGFSYIYFIYGMYFCFNVVGAVSGVPEAVLIRALDPLEGVDLMKKEKPLAEVHQLANGPGKLCNALGLNIAQNNLDLVTSKVVWIEDGPRCEDIISGPRIGIGDKHDAVHWPLRFAVRGHRAISPAKFPSDDDDSML